MSEYTGGNNGWGTMIYRCPFCGEIVAEYNCDEDGVPTDRIFDNADSHKCPDENED